MSIASMAAALEEKTRQREREEELSMTGPQSGEQNTTTMPSITSLQEAAAALDAILAGNAMMGNAVVNGALTPQQYSNSITNAVSNTMLPWWNDNHPAKLNMKRIQASLKAERVSQKLTQRDLAKKANMSQGSIARAEKNGWISITTLLRIANTLGKEISLN